MCCCCCEPLSPGETSSSTSGNPVQSSERLPALRDGVKVALKLKEKAKDFKVFYYCEEFWELSISWPLVWPSIIQAVFCWFLFNVVVQKWIKQRFLHTSWNQEGLNPAVGPDELQMKHGGGGGGV